MAAAGFLNLPNILSLSRLVLAPPICAFIVRGDWGLALVLCISAGVTDMLDGFLARRMNVETATGAYLDPICDKALLTAVYVSLAAAGGVPVWLVALVIGRDLMILVGARALMRLRGVTRFPPSLLGKLSTAIQIAAVVAILAGFGGVVVIAVVGLVTAASGVDYIVRGIRMAQRPRPPAAA